MLTSYDRAVFGSVKKEAFRAEKCLETFEKLLRTYDAFLSSLPRNSVYEESEDIIAMLKHAERGISDSLDDAGNSLVRMVEFYSDKMADMKQYKASKNT